MRSIVRTAHRYAPKVAAGAFLSPRAGARKGEPPPLSPPLRRGTKVTVKQILYSLQNCSLGQSAARAPTPATPHHPQFPHKMRRRHLESVSSRSLAARGSWGTAPSVFWFLLYAQKERPGGEPYRPSPCGDSAPPLGDHKLAPPGRHTDYAFVKGPATPKATTNLAPAG